MEATSPLLLLLQGPQELRIGWKLIVFSSTFSFKVPLRIRWPKSTHDWWCLHNLTHSLLFQTPLFLTDLCVNILENFHSMFKMALPSILLSLCFQFFALESPASNPLQPHPLSLPTHPTSLLCSKNNQASVNTSLLSLHRETRAPFDLN